MGGKGFRLHDLTFGCREIERFSKNFLAITGETIETVAYSLGGDATRELIAAFSFNQSIDSTCNVEVMEAA